MQRKRAHATDRLNRSRYHFPDLIFLYIRPRHLRVMREHGHPFFWDRFRVVLFLALDGLERVEICLLYTSPMAGVTDTVFRRFIRNLGGCGLIMTEFTSADGVLRKKDQKAKRYLHFYEDEHPISAQLFGSNPEVMAEAARMVEGLGFDVVDLNLGCPAKKVVKCNGGSGLLRDLPAIGRIFEAVRAAVTIPFTVK